MPSSSHDPRLSPPSSLYISLFKGQMCVLNVAQVENRFKNNSVSDEKISFFLMDGQKISTGSLYLFDLSQQKIYSWCLNVWNGCFLSATLPLCLMKTICCLDEAKLYFH